MKTSDLRPPWRRVDDEMSTLGGPATLLYADGGDRFPIAITDSNSAAIAQFRDGKVSSLTVLPNGPGLSVDRLIGFTSTFEAWLTSRGFRANPRGHDWSKVVTASARRDEVKAGSDAELRSLLADETVAASEVNLFSLERGRVTAGVAAGNGRRKDGEPPGLLSGSRPNEWRMIINIADVGAPPRS